MNVELLGSITATLQDQEVDLGSPRQRALFAMLASHANQPVSRAELIDAVWGATQPTTVESSVYTYIARLRRSLEPTRGRGRPARILVTDGSGYVLHLAPLHVDSYVFEGHLTQARWLRQHGVFRGAVAEIDRALRLWRGTPLGGAIGPFVEAERARLGEHHFVAVEERAELLLQLDQPEEVISDLAGLVRRFPFRERLRRLLMMGYFRCGRRADALAEFRRVRELLIRELGIEPSAELQRCHEEILRGRSGGIVPHAFPGASTVRTPPAQLPRDVPDFTGRASELHRLDSLVTHARAIGEAAVILITGAPGVGKSALAAHFAHKVAATFDEGQLYVNLQGLSANRRPMAPGDALGLLIAGLSNEHDVPDILEIRVGLFRTLIARRRLLILLDNADSAEQVRPLLPGTPSCMVLVTSRHRLPGLSARDGAHPITLQTLTDDDAVSLLGNVNRAERICGPPVLKELARACDNLPLALRITSERIINAHADARAQLVEAFLDNGHLLDHLDIDKDSLTSVRTVFEASYRRMSEITALTFRLLGLHPGSSISLASAACVIEATTEETRERLAGLVHAHILEEIERDRFRFENRLIREYAKQRALSEEPLAQREHAMENLFSFYARTAQAAVHTLRSGSVSGETRSPFHSTAEAEAWFQAELTNMVAVVRELSRSTAGGAGPLTEVIQRLLTLSAHEAWPRGATADDQPSTFGRP